MLEGEHFICIFSGSLISVVLTLGAGSFFMDAPVLCIRGHFSASLVRTHLMSALLSSPEVSPDVARWGKAESSLLRTTALDEYAVACKERMGYFISKQKPKWSTEKREPRVLRPRLQGREGGANGR